MARSVFFSFHYKRDIMRVQQVKQHYITKGSYTETGFFDGSLEEKEKVEGTPAVRKLIDNGLYGSSVLCVLIGNETFKRRWVHYEIFRAAEYGMGIFGIRIHQLKDPKLGADSAGLSPFDVLGYGTKDGKMRPMISYADGWKDAPHVTPISESAAPYLKMTDRPILNRLFSVYDWVDSDGYNNFGKWVEAAAKQAGR